MSMMALMKTLDVFGRERLVVAREYARGRYDAMEYVLAKLITELPLDAACECLSARTQVAKHSFLKRPFSNLDSLPVPHFGRRGRLWGASPLARWAAIALRGTHRTALPLSSMLRRSRPGCRGADTDGRCGTCAWHTRHAHSHDGRRAEPGRR